MRRMYRSTLIMVSITVLLVLLSVVSGLSLVANASTLEDIAGIRRFNVMKLEVLLNPWLLPEEARQRYFESPPALVEVDYSKRITNDDYYWQNYGIRAEDATEEYFAFLMSKEYEELTTDEIRQLFGYLRWNETFRKMKTDFYRELAYNMGYPSVDEMLRKIDYFCHYVPRLFYDELVEYYSVSELYDMYEEGLIYYKDYEVSLESVVLRSLQDLPEKYQDPDIILSRRETRKMLREALSSSTYVKVLLPQVRRNAERYGFSLPFDTIQNEIKASYIEDKFREMGLLDY